MLFAFVWSLIHFLSIVSCAALSKFFDLCFKRFVRFFNKPRLNSSNSVSFSNKFVKSELISAGKFSIVSKYSSNAFEAISRNLYRATFLLGLLQKLDHSVHTIYPCSSKIITLYK